ncbi:PLP-dependent aminotransferase family protein [Solwaraspora sp. WMMD1047]|uniref:MocR-like pyridoxine biosynthesis transcription factor PdxR n=1 Tax=Solwaraspora sp. WMMD1047 TaxID=3016102 RepID=UPI002415EE97|nr:PLP-dependent aminotransferase family protein [Solwaraspora sp. WMMD1047]MDG4831786.1 PLP-dependent aminotransferase family protein [Solwaraspora sp. WMMD1047]
MDLHVRLTGRTNLVAQIREQLRAAVLAGRLRPGDVLPASRTLAARLGVSRNTVSTAYERLAAEGLLTTRTGAGTFVSGPPPAGERPGPAVPGPESEPAPPTDPGTRGALAPRAVWNRIPPAPDLSRSPRFDFRPGMPDVRQFPFATWRRLLNQDLRASRVGNGLPDQPSGHAGLRSAITRHIGLSRAVRAEPDDVLVTNGTQQAADLVGRVLLTAGDTVAVEEPGYRLIRLLFESLGARVVGVPVDDQGLVVDALPPEARLVYVTPSHQMPTGVAMSLPRRLALLGWAGRHDAAILEDDYDSEFRYTDQPLEPLQCLDVEGRVVYAGSFSKVLLPTLRLGFLVAPPTLRHALRSAKFVTDWHTSLPTQAALARFIDEGGLARHLRRSRNVYRRRHELVAAALSGDLAPWLEPIPSAAGLHLGAFLRDGVADRIGRVLADARAAGVEVLTFSHVAAAGSSRPGLVFGYGAIPAERIEEGLHLFRHHLRNASAA